MSLKSIVERLTLSENELTVLHKLRYFRKYGVSYVPLFKRDRGLCIICSLPLLSNIKGIFEEWERFSGNSLFPVPATEAEGAWKQYMTYPLYEGKQLTLRHSLAQHCIKHIESSVFFRASCILGITVVTVGSLLYFLT